MKVYDKEIYTKQESIKTTAIIILVFLIGFVAGYLANSFSNNNTNNIKNEITKLIIPSIQEDIEVRNMIVKLTQSSSYLEMTITEKEKAVNNLLNDLKGNGKIKEYNYDNENNLYSFTYADGTLGGLILEDSTLEIE